MIEKGMNGKFETSVSDANTAETMKSGSLEVFATPALVAALEAAAVSAVEGSLSAEETTVGCGISITHAAPSVIGSHITASATVIAVNGRQISFSVTASDEGGIIGEGEHTRVIVNKDKFLSKAKGRSEGNVN
ncbi:MAG: dihydrolipoamide acyltransferase [Clostridia bacterium]|nr:dihydrolipoamide acyltransferase [Clostridia bacterium]